MPLDSRLPDVIGRRATQAAGERAAKRRRLAPHAPLSAASSTSAASAAICRIGWTAAATTH